MIGMGVGCVSMAVVMMVVVIVKAVRMTLDGRGDRRV